MLYNLLLQMSLETISFLIIIFAFALYFHINFTAANAIKAPAILTTLGIFATFVGIGIGLSEFDANNIQKSVPVLIAGIKTAVWASAWGILCALTIKIREAITGTKKKITATKTSGATVDDLASILTSVQQALVGNDDSTLLSQLKLARQDTNDRLDKLNRSLDDFGSKMADNNSKALIEALEGVMRDFNTKINEQFGDNFKQLNQAVEKILVWQDQYRHQIVEMIEQQSLASNNMATATEKYQILVSQAENFTITANSMSSLLIGLQEQKGQLNVSLQALANLINTASTGLPEIEKKIVEMTAQISNGVKSTNEELKTVLLNVIHASNQEFNSHIKQIADKTKEQVTVLDNALSAELTKSLESLGRQLAALSTKFVQDYGPLTERLQSLVKMAG